ncbi:MULTISPECIES: DNA sulfur modification protein DndD [unclassified Pseudomonas]|uniref:DNA sulfur modification protein DndD n=1 Tax=unclassified Pseudomonas TaxID=196821 RepID=UPI000CD0975C|nr:MULTISPECIES: DNA sulfur modification protein DndD [unclassified Pseudomonas]POA57758.1 DNA sulfur modification protein DndD [Pseudomonas sp. FW507-12TSA]
MSQAIEFTSIEVENIFAYEGKSTIDLRDCNGDRSIVVISGQNGAGKTSLLNAIKLLFLGPENEEIRRVGFGGIALSPKHFVLGQPGRWYGVFNKHARDISDRSRVKLSWVQDGKPTTLERVFSRTSNTTFTDQLIITHSGQHLTDSESRAFLASLAPSEIVPFYFFDGEQVQSFADAEEGRERGEIERLLKLSFITDLLRELDSYSKSKRRAGLPTEVQHEIVQAENALREAEAKIESLNRLRIETETESEELSRKQEQLDSHRDGLRTGISEEEQRRMLNRIAILDMQREKLNADLCEVLPPEAPWLVNLGIVRQVYQLLDQQMTSSTDMSLSNKLHGELPQALRSSLSHLEPPVELSSSQYQAFSDAIKQALAQRGLSADACVSPLLLAVSPKQVKALRDRYLVWAERGPALVAAQTEQLRRMRSLTQEAEQARRDLEEAELTTEGAKHRFDELSTEIAALSRQIEAYRETLAELRIKEAQTAESAEQARQRIRQCEQRHSTVTKENRAYQLSLRVRRALEFFRDKKRMQIRQSVEDHLNERISVLLAPSQLIKSVTLDDLFVMRYFDEQGDEVARRSISAGMRQLVAMGMLWALRDESARELPVMIDTPLGRIDRENRSLLMSEYFPNAGKPLVLLPTNSEMDEDVLRSLDGFIRRRYEIQNEGGTRARIVQIDAKRYDGISTR